MDEFSYQSYAQEVLFGSGSLSKLGEALDRYGSRKVLLCTNGSMRRAGHAAALEAALGDRLAAVFDETQPHVPDVQVEAVLALAVEKDVDAVVGLGGGSPIGMAKAVAFELEGKRFGRPSRPASPAERPRLPVAAVPTTYAGSEMTAVYGVTHTRETPPRKVTVSDPKIAPNLVIYDPRLTLDLPPEMTASTGINALAHCVEALYSISRHPLSTAAALSGARAIHASLLRCYTHGDDLEARSAMLVGAHLAGLSLAGVAMGLHHGVCHVLGGTAGVPHGIANSILLPHAIRFNADATAPLLLPLAEALGISVNGHGAAAAVESAARSIAELTGRMNLPQRLRDAGVSKADLPRLADLAFENRTVRNNPKPITSAAQIERLLQAAW